MLFLLLIMFLFVGCNESEKITEEDLLAQAQQKLETQDYKGAADRFEKIEKEHPLSKNMEEISYQKALAYYKDGDYAIAAAAFDSFIDQYPNHKYKANAMKYSFLCFYNQLTRFDRNFILLQKSIEKANTFKSLNVEDKEFEEAAQRLDHFIVYYYLSIIKLSLAQAPKLWIQAAWNASIIINEYPNSPYAPEAFFRMIEFLVNQKNVGCKKDAVILYKQMQKLHETSEWTLHARNLFTVQNLDVGNNLIIDSCESKVLMLSD